MNNDRYHIKENANFLKSLGMQYGNVLNRTTMINFVKDAKEKVKKQRPYKLMG